MGKFHMLLIVCWLGPALQPAHAEGLPNAPVLPVGNCSATDQLVVLSGNDLTPLLGTPVHQLSLLRVSGTRLAPIVFQIDRRDGQGRYIIEEADIAASGHAVVELDDELIFLASDGGVRLSDAVMVARREPLVEIRLRGTIGAPPKWVYVHVSDDPKPPHSARYIDYDTASDVVTSAIYRLGFSRQLPFLVDTFRWKTGDAEGWSQDVVDTMKIRHQGRFLGFIPFQRTQRDYTSRLTGAKIGPLRVIRRTENRIRVLWHLKTPVVYIDYVMMPGGFAMDTVIDIPFNVGLFFSDVETLTTVDGNDDPGLPSLTIHVPGDRRTLTVNGQMSSEKRQFNLLQSNQFALISSLGKMLVSLEIPPGVPITPWLYLRDALNQSDPPENRVGQFGNVGFRTTGWEQINTEVHHLKFTVCLKAPH